MSLTHTTLEIHAGKVKSLAWDGDELIDVTTNRRFGMDGHVGSGEFFMPYSFDRGLSLQANEVLWTLAYDNRGTKSVLLRNGTVHRELNRSYYCAEAFDYPVALIQGPNGAAAVIHCPNSFDQLEIEDAETGETLLSKKSSKMEFHSRLAVSPNHRLILSAGWFWHPLCGAWVFSPWSDTSPEVDFDFGFGSELDGVGFLGDDHLVVSTNAEVMNGDVPKNGLGPLRLGVWSIADGSWKSEAELEELAGTLMPWRDWVISFHGHPKAIDLVTGAVVYRWDQIASGKQVGAIDLGEPVPPPMALDPVRGRFAVAREGGITVVRLDSQE